MLPVLVVLSPLPRRHFGAAAGGVHPIITPVSALGPVGRAFGASRIAATRRSSAAASARAAASVAEVGPAARAHAARPGSDRCGSTKVRHGGIFGENAVGTPRVSDQSITSSFGQYQVSDWTGHYERAGVFSWHGAQHLHMIAPAQRRRR